VDLLLQNHLLSALLPLARTQSLHYNSVADASLCNLTPLGSSISLLTLVLTEVRGWTSPCGVGSLSSGACSFSAETAGLTP
jgi:hypothetical protein